MVFNVNWNRINDSLLLQTIIYLAAVLDSFYWKSFSAKNGPCDCWCGQKTFNLLRWVQIPYGLPVLSFKYTINRTWITCRRRDIYRPVEHGTSRNATRTDYRRFSSLKWHHIGCSRNLLLTYSNQGECARLLTENETGSIPVTSAKSKLNPREFS